MLLEDVQFAGEYPSFADPFDKNKPCLLHKIQSDLLKGEVAIPEDPLDKDGSVVVVSAHSPHRELMILKDRILYWLDEEPDLALKDIVVMAPDIQDYSGMIPAVFHDIPHSIADRNPSLSNRFLAVYLQFLSLCSGRFGWGEVLDLLEREEVYPRFEIHKDELELIRHWVVSSGIRWGMSGKQKQDMGLPGRDECTWRSGLDRLLMGYATGDAGDGSSILPYPDIEGGMATPLGGLTFFSELLEEATEQFSKSHSLAEWAGILTGFVDRLFVTVDNDGLVELYGILTDLGLEYGDLHRAGVSFEVIRSWMQRVAEEKRSSAGFLRGQLTFCSMLPMRSIPFRKVCLLGLNDTVFPKNDFHPPFDLLGDNPIPGDRSRRSDDRYQFLEAILSARESLYLSYVGQSIRSNDTLPPSVVVSELSEIAAFYGAKELIDIHPLHGFSSSYFDGAGGLFSYNRQLMGVCSALQKKNDTPEPWWQERIEVERRESCTVTELFSFFRNPQRYFVRDILGIHLGRYALSMEEHEPFVLDTLQKYLAEQDLVDGGISGTGQRLQQQMQASGLWPLGTPGDISFAEKEKELRYFVELVTTQKAVGSEEDRYIDGDFCDMHISGKIGSFYGNGSFLFRYTGLKGGDVFRAWLHHCLSAICLHDARETRLLTKDMELVFPAASVTEEDLRELLTLFQGGQQAPSMLMVEAVFAYAVQVVENEKRGRTDPIVKATQTVEKSLDSGFEAEWEMLYQGQSLERYLGQEFSVLCNWFYESIWKRAHVRKI